MEGNNNDGAQGGQIGFKKRGVNYKKWAKKVAGLKERMHPSACKHAHATSAKVNWNILKRAKFNPCNFKDYGDFFTKQRDHYREQDVH